MELTTVCGALSLRMAEYRIGAGIMGKPTQSPDLTELPNQFFWCAIILLLVKCKKRNKLKKKKKNLYHNTYFIDLL